MEEQNSQEAWENEIQAYSPMVYRLALAQTGSKADAEDVCQEVFLQYWKHRAHLSTEEHKKAWLVRVTVNCCRKQWRGWKKWVTGFEEGKEGEIPFAFATLEETQLFQAVQKLPEAYRGVIHLFYYEDMSVEQVGQALHRKRSTVRTQLTRARRLLKAYFEEEEARKDE